MTTSEDVLPSWLKRDISNFRWIFLSKLSLKSAIVYVERPQWWSPILLTSLYYTAINVLNVFHYSTFINASYWKGKKQEENMLEVVPNSTCLGSLQTEIQVHCIDCSGRFCSKGLSKSNWRIINDCGTKEGGAFTVSTTSERFF